jgi:peptidyl-prolyl cis-trans isomerase C
MNPLQKSVVTALCIGISLALSPVGQALAAETKAADQKAPAEQKAKETVKTSPDDTVAKVGNTVITRAEMDRAAAILLKQNKPQQPLTAEQTKQVNDYVLEQLIAAELLYQAGAKLEVKDLEKKIDERIAEGKGRFQTPEQFQAALKEQGIDEKILREYTR